MYNSRSSPEEVAVPCTLVTWLLDHGADANQVDSNTCQTVLMIAAVGSCHGIVRSLLEHGADVTTLDRDGKGVLDMVSPLWDWSTTRLCNKYRESNVPQQGLLLK